MSSEGSGWIARLHAAPARAVLAVTGGGSRAVADLLGVPGASASVLEAIVPYAEASLREWLGGPPAGSCSPETALAMAGAAHRRALALAAATPGVDPDAPLVGLGCTCSLASDRPKRGDHRIHIATQTRDATRLLSLELAKGQRDRAGEEEVARRLVLGALGAAFGVPGGPEPVLAGDEALRVEEARGDPLVVEILAGRRPLAWSLPGGAFAERCPTPLRGLLSGSFNPLHPGHRALREAAARHLGGAVEYELCLWNADKPPLDYLGLARRLAQFPADPVLLTRAPTFAEKAALAPGATFVVGADTALRIVDRRFYGDDPAGVARALAALAGAGCRLLVAGRHDGSRFVTLRDVPVPTGFAELFEELPETSFRADLSSSVLRAERGL